MTIRVRVTRGESGERDCMSCGNRGWTPYEVETIDGDTEEALELCTSCRSVEEANEELIQELPGGGFIIPSFTNENKAYMVHPESGYCSCKRYKFTGHCEKHVTLAEAIGQLRTQPRTNANDEEYLIELVHGVFARVKPGESNLDSYKLFLEVSASKFSTDALVRASMRRHGHVLNVNEPSEGRAA